jgi:hypothetical protein
MEVGLDKQSEISSSLEKIEESQDLDFIKNAIHLCPEDNLAVLLIIIVFCTRLLL